MELTPAERLRRRRNVVLLLVFSAITIALALFPSVCTYVEQPQDFWPTAAAAPRSGADAIPALVPAAATEIHVRRDPRNALYWLRFAYPPAEHDRMVAGLRKLTLNEARALVIEGPSFTPWWTVNQGTMLRRAGERLEVYVVTPNRAWLVLDPSSHLAFYWRRG